MNNNNFEVTNLCCHHCKYYNCRADMMEETAACKRIDHKLVKFAVPWFKSYDCDYGTICRDFQPRDHQPAISAEWEQLGGFSGWWPLWVDQWLPYGNTNKLVYFVINNDTSIRYGVPLMDYVNGTMIDSGVLRAVEKMWYSRHKVSEKFPTGYELIKQPIDGIKIT